MQKQTLHSRCPHCQTVFKLKPAHLNVAQGYVRCGHCHNVFNGRFHLVTLSQSEKSPHLVTQEDSYEAISQEEVPDLLKEDIYQGRSWSSLLFWGIVIILCIGVLLGQYVWLMQRDTVLQNPEIRPWLEKFCYHLLCTLPPTRDTSLFRINERMVVAHPEVANAIQIDATFTNEAAFPQPYPHLQITFQDVNGQSLFQRLFKPNEYLKTAELLKDMQPGEKIHLRLELTDKDNQLEKEMVNQWGYKIDFY